MKRTNVKNFLSSILIIFTVLMFTKASRVNAEMPERIINCNQLYKFKIESGYVHTYKLQVQKSTIFSLEVIADKVYDKSGLISDDRNFKGNDIFYISLNGDLYEPIIDETDLPYGQIKKYTIYLEKGTYDLDIMGDRDEGLNYKYMGGMIVCRYETGKAVPFTDAEKIVQANLEPSLTYQKNDSNITIATAKISSSINGEYGYDTGVSITPKIYIKRVGNSSEAAFVIRGKYHLHGSFWTDSIELVSITIGSQKNNESIKCHYQLDYNHETNIYSDKEYYSRDDCNFKCTVFHSTKSTEKQVDKLINCVDSSKVYIKTNGVEGDYYKAKLTRSQQEQLVRQLKLYKKILKIYQ